VTRMDVVHGTPKDLDKPRFDISSWISDINKLKMQIPVLQEEGIWRPLCAYNLPYLFLQKSSAHGAEPIIVCINKQLTNDTVVEEWMLPQEMKGCKKVIQLLKSPDVYEEIPSAFILDPADILIFVNR